MSILYNNIILHNGIQRELKDDGIEMKEHIRNPWFQSLTQRLVNEV